MTVNLDEVALKVFRVGDRNLVSAIGDKLFGAPIDGYGERRLADRFGAPVWEGTGEVANRLNADMTTAVPALARSAASSTTAHPGRVAMRRA